MLNLRITNWKKALESAIPDAIAGIQIAHLCGDNSFSLYVTAIPSSQHVKPHYHEADTEIYQIVEGHGLLHLAYPAQNKQHINKSSHQVKSGDCFTIPPNTIHQLENNSSLPLILIFGCPASHLSTDRIAWQNLLE